MLEIKLNSQDVFNAINTWAGDVFSSILRAVKASTTEGIGWRTRQLLTMHDELHPKSNVDRLYLSRSEGSRGLIGVHDDVQAAILGFRNCVRNSK